MGSAAASLAGIVKTMRPKQWVKNLFVLTPVVFAKELFDVAADLRSLSGFSSFCLLASAVYFLNDIVDVEADRAHPVKRKRPIASGVVPMKLAKGITGALVVIACSSGLWLGWKFVGCALAYFTLNVAYSLRLKKVAYFDVLCIALGFELRVLSGAFAARVPASTYLLTVTFLLASFLGFGKRMHELVHSDAASVSKQREVLDAYNMGFLTALLYSTAIATLLVYVVYTLDPWTRHAFGSDYVAVTAVFAVFGVFRFVHLVRSKDTVESPTEQMLRDKLFIGNLVLWAASIVLVIYWGRML